MESVYRPAVEDFRSKLKEMFTLAALKPQHKSFTSRQGRQIVCYKCHKAPGALVQVHEYEYLILGYEGAEQFYSCKGSCKEQAEVAYLRVLKQHTKQQQAKQRKYNRLLEIARKRGISPAKLLEEHGY